MSDKPSFLARLFRGTWRLIDFSRRVAHLVFLLVFFTIVGGVIVATSGETVLMVRDGTVNETDVTAIAHGRGEAADLPLHGEGFNSWPYGGHPLGIF